MSCSTTKWKRCSRLAMNSAAYKRNPDAHDSAPASATEGGTAIAPLPEFDAATMRRLQWPAL